MTSQDILDIRLLNQHLTYPDFKKASDVVSHIGAVQAQDYPAAKWALSLRMENATDQKVEQSINDGEILRTHIMRPTWHFVLPEDILWMQELTSKNVKRIMGSYNKKLELDDTLFKKTNSLILKALRNHNYLTRQEIKKLLEEINIKTDVQRLAHIVMWAELDGLICSGPRRGKPASPNTSQVGQFTYALTGERVSKAKKFSRDESLAKLATKYFQSHGPAQLKDFSWWSGLSSKDATEGLDMIKSKLHHNVVNSKNYWFFPTPHAIHDLRPKAYLLSIYDEYTIAYKDRNDISDNRDIERFIKMGNALTAVIVLNGKAVGTWKRVLKKKAVETKLSVFRELTTKELKAMEKAVDKYAAFLNMKAKSIYTA